MAQVYVTADAPVRAPASTVYALISNFREHHPRFLPSNFSEYGVEQGGSGAGTVITFTITAMGRTRGYRMRVSEPEPGRVMTESDTMSTMVTTWTVTPEGADACRVQIETRWEGAAGVPGFFERLFAPRGLRRIYRNELKRLDRYAREQVREQTLVAGRR
jgi:ribosome-associated toxin RatA of RatAB toxin-antitoxin module